MVTLLSVALHPGGEVKADATASAVRHVGSRNGADQLEVCGDFAERVQFSCLHRRSRLPYETVISADGLSGRSLLEEKREH